MRTTKVDLRRPRLLLALLGAAIVLAIAASGSSAQVPLSAYTDRNGYINVQALTCAQLANTFQEDADFLAAWYSGWYNGLAKKHFAHVARAKAGEHEVIMLCKERPHLKIIQAIDIVLKKNKKR